MPKTRQDELDEYPFVGPFGGIQTEVSSDQIGNTGFLDAQNIIFRKSQAQNAPGQTSLTQIPAVAETPLGFGGFFGSDGAFKLFAITPTRLFSWNGAAWTQITGALTGTTQLFGWSSLGYKLYFSQGIDPIQTWDGIAAAFSAVAGAPKGRLICELDDHLLVSSGIFSTSLQSRLFYSGAGDGTDWTSFSSGQIDLFNGQGPITGLTKLSQAGYVFQFYGVSQIDITGIGLAPFRIVSLASLGKGCAYPQSLATYGELISCYAGYDDIFVFDGTQAIPIGSRPIDGNRRLGARSSILADLTAIPGNVCGYISASSDQPNVGNNSPGINYGAYWLVITAQKKAWVYHFDEANWTQVFFNTSQAKGPIGSFWPSASALKSPVVTFSDDNAKTLTYFDFALGSSSPTNGSINGADGFYIKSGALTFDDPRHQHVVKKIRFRFIDKAAITLSLRLTNETGQTSGIISLTYGSGSGNPITKVVSFNLPGTYITWELSGPKNVLFDLIEVAPIYTTSGEIQGG